MRYTTLRSNTRMDVLIRLTLTPLLHSALRSYAHSEYTVDIQ